MGKAFVGKDALPLADLTLCRRRGDVLHPHRGGSSTCARPPCDTAGRSAVQLPRAPHCGGGAVLAAAPCFGPCFSCLMPACACLPHASPPQSGVDCAACDLTCQPFHRSPARVARRLGRDAGDTSPLSDTPTPSTVACDTWTRRTAPGRHHSVAGGARVVRAPQRGAPRDLPGRACLCEL